MEPSFTKKFKITHDFDSSEKFGPQDKFYFIQNYINSLKEFELILVATGNVIQPSNQLKLTFVWNAYEDFEDSQTSTILLKNGSNSCLVHVVDHAHEIFAYHVMVLFHKDPLPPPPQKAPQPKPKIQEISSSLIDDFKRFKEDEDSKDVTFIIGTQEIRAHKQILAARSEVFSRMFSVDMSESRTNQVVITDIKVACFQALLNYIYTNACPEANATEELLYAAGKYELTDLKKRVAKHLAQRLNDKNALQLLVQFDRFDIQDCRKQAMDYAVKHKQTVLTPQKRREFQNQHSKLACEVYEKLCFN